jgi:hypothetical protein
MEKTEIEYKSEGEQREMLVQAEHDCAAIQQLLSHLEKPDVIHLHQKEISANQKILLQKVQLILFSPTQIHTVFRLHTLLNLRK